MNDDELEEFYIKGQRKDSRKERRQLSIKDRSKFKKSNEDKQLKITPPLKKDELRGRVLSIQGQVTIVESNTKKYSCVLRGVLKRDRQRKKNLLVVGDWVQIKPLSETEGVITFIEQRKSTLSRSDNLSRNKEHLIASNIDQVFITLSVVIPPLKRSLVDRYLISAKKGNMSPVILINKIDLLNSTNPSDILKEEKQNYNEFIETFKKLEIPCLAVSVEKKIGLIELEKMMQNKASVFSGQSGVGKSSLINALTGLTLPTGDTVERTRKGSHTTTRAQLIPLDFGGWCIDTPGIKSFGVWDLIPQEIRDYFPEFVENQHQCQYSQCLHIHEPGCYIKQLIEEGKIHPFRHESYLMLMKTATEKHKKR